jgi:mannose-1-phosphate guanylyltransferase / mannose-6-phosphate isomerase
MSDTIIPLVMCGGAGTRLWPASRESQPKQFLPLFGQYSTFQETIRRVSDPVLFGRPIVVTNASYRFLVAEQLAALGVEADILLEPARRDSAPAIAAGAEFARTRGGDPIIVALAADHMVDDAAAFSAVCATAREAAQNGYIVTFGVRASRAATEYGYIRPGDPISADIFAVGEFVEKPKAETAACYMQRGYLWNSGNFMFRASALLEEYRDFEPLSAKATAAAVERAGSDLGFVILDSESFARAVPRSIDYAVMERTKRAAVIPVAYKWSDVGSWNAVWELTPRDSAGNAAHGNAVFIESCNSYATSDSALVSMFGVENIVVAATQDAVLVARRDDPDGMRRLVKTLKQVAPNVTEQHLKVHRPWGSYQSIDNGQRHQVKRIVVKPGGRLSLQLHHHRAEHWVVVRGTAQVVVGEETKMLNENESIYIPLGSRHRLANPGKIDLELIEVQTGSYLGEDDIVRFDDDYQRA